MDSYKAHPNSNSNSNRVQLGLGQHHSQKRKVIPNQFIYMGDGSLKIYNLGENIRKPKRLDYRGGGGGANGAALSVERIAI